MQWRCALALGCVLSMPGLGCGASMTSKGTTAPSSASRQRRSSGREAYGHCCTSGSSGRTSGEILGGSSSCDEIEQLGQRFSTAKPIRVLSGKATYYSDSLSGHAMASGEIYRPDCAQAAHRTLPFGTVVRVRSVKSGATVVVRIADRGPFAGKSRIIDLSYGAARKIGLLREGVADVRVEVLQLPNDASIRR
jgi:rare lipoprotein A